MTESTARARRRGARIDPRLLIGVALILGSVLGVSALVSSLDDSVEVYRAKATLTPGTRVDADDLIAASVRLGVSTDRYLAPGALPDDGLLVTRTVLEGELVPASAVDRLDAGDSATIVVPTRSGLPSTVRPGSTVDVWAAEPQERGAYGPPAVLVAGAEVAVVGEDAGPVVGEGRPVELVVPREKIAALLEALAAGDAIDLVPARAGGAG